MWNYVPIYDTMRHYGPFNTLVSLKGLRDCLINGEKIAQVQRGQTPRIPWHGSLSTFRRSIGRIIIIIINIIIVLRRLSTKD